MAPEVFAFAPSRQNYFRPSPSHGIESPPESTHGTLPPSLISTAASPGVPAPLTPRIREIHSPRVYLARFVPPSGFLNLLTVFPSPHLVALFHATDVCGVLPSELSPPRGTGPPLDGLCPPVVLPPAPPFRRRTVPGGRRLQGFVPLVESVAPVRCYARRCPLLSWAFPSLGFSLSLPWRLLPTSSPPDLGFQPAEAFLPLGLQGFPLPGAWLVSEETADPSEVFHLAKLANG